MDLYYVSVVERERLFGGPEEGGWYYEFDTPVLNYPFSNIEAAYDFASRMRDTFYVSSLHSGCDDYDRRRDVYSVLYSGGDHSVWVDTLPALQPEYEHYE